MILAVTGHRPNKLGGYKTPNPIYNSVMEGLDRLLLELRPEKVITGMAMGVDQWMAELCVWNGVPFVAAIPFENFDSKWYESTRRKYRELLSKAAEVVYVCRGEFSSWKMQRRNEWMVNHCHVLGAVFDGTDGGTANTVGYARSSGKAIRYVDFLRSPPLVSNERPMIAAPVQVSVPRAEDPPTAASEIFRQMREENHRRQQQESEGQRAARRAAREALRIEAERQALEEQLLERVERQQRARRNRLTIVDSTAEQVESEKAPKEEEPKTSVLEFSRFVDLDV